MREHVIEFVKKNKYLVVLLLFAATLLFTSLGDRTLFGDEDFTLLVSKTIADNGLPAASHGEFRINPKDTAHAAIFGKEVYTWNSWLQYYITAGVYSVFGLNETALRFPFVLFGLSTVLLLYLFAKELTKSKRIAIVSTLLLTTSVTFLLHMRQVRWYSLVTFFSLAVMYSYWGFIKSGKTKWLVISSILLFHSNIMNFFILVATLFSHFAVFNFTKTKFKKALKSSLVIALFTAPWFFLTNQLAKFSGTTSSLLKIAFNFMLNWYYVFILLFPAVLLMFFLFKKYRRILLRPEYTFLVFVVVVYISILSLKSDVLPGVRYLVHLVPVFSILTALIVTEIYKKQKLAAVGLVTVLVLTNLLNLFPFLLMEPLASNFDTNISDYNKEKFIDDSLQMRAPMFDYLYELTHDYTSSEELIFAYINQNKNTDDTFTTSNFENAVIVYTDLRYVDPNDINEPIDWIVVRSFRIGEEQIGAFTKTVTKKVDIEKYHEIHIHSFDERWADSPDPLSHRYRTNQNGLVKLYHLE